MEALDEEVQALVQANAAPPNASLVEVDSETVVVPVGTKAAPVTMTVERAFSAARLCVERSVRR
jgi:hypothetical protein